MVADLAYRSYTSLTLWHTFLKDIPDVVTSEHVSDLHKKDEWKKFMDSCTDGADSDPFSSKPSGSNEKEFRKLVQCVVELEGLAEYFGETQETTKEELEMDNPRWGRVRISHQGDQRMRTWNDKAKWLNGDCGSTERRKELKPDLMSAVVENVDGRHPRKAKPSHVRFAKPETILPPPNDWKPEQMKDGRFPIVKSKDPVWECLDLFWECKRNSQILKNAEVYIDCALKAAEALRYQWSRRYVYCFLHCGTKMQLLHFDRSGLMASETLDIEKNTDTFVQYLLGVFRHKPIRLGYPAGKDAPVHRHDPDNRLLQVVTVGGRELYIDDQEAGPPRDHLVSRATMVFKAKLVKPDGKEKTGWDYCYKSSWAQIGRKHEGKYLERLQHLPNVVDMVVYGVVKAENNDDTTVFARQCSSGDAMTILERFFDRAKKQNRDFIQHTGTRDPDQEDPEAMLLDPRRPKGKSPQNCDNREHRDVVTAWVNSSFNEAASSGSLSTASSIWQQAFSAIKSIREAGIIHRDISYRNIRIDGQHKIKVCDFDMAMDIEHKPTGADDRTGTIAFMATSMLSSEPRIHRPVHDCESIFWLCALDLLTRVAIGDARNGLANIMNPGRGTTMVTQAKKSVVSDLCRLKPKSKGLEPFYSLESSKDRLLFFCLATLAREVDENDYSMDYTNAEEGFEDVCFDRCIKIIKALDSSVEEVTERIA